jgi:hypothetical protein
VTLKALANLARIGKLKVEPAAQKEFDGLVKSGRARLRDACNPGLSIDSRFDLAYNAAHALSLAALRWHGYRSENRYVVFQALGTHAGHRIWLVRVLTKCHDKRNLAEYEGIIDIDERLLEDLLSSASELETRVVALGPVTAPGKPTS